MNSNQYNINVSIELRNGNKLKLVTSRETFVDEIKNAHLMRAKEWVESEHPYTPGYHNPYRIVSLKFNKQTGNLESVELKETSK